MRENFMLILGVIRIPLFPIQCLTENDCPPLQLRVAAKGTARDIYGGYSVGPLAAQSGTCSVSNADVL